MLTATANIHRYAFILGVALLARSARGQDLSSAVPSGKKVYADPTLHVAFAYPEELQVESPQVAGQYSYRSRFAMHPENDPEHRNADPCSPILLAVGMGADRPKDPGHPGHPGHQVPLLPTGGITLNEIKHSCITKDMPGTADENALGDMVEQIRHIDGIPPIAKTITYEVQGRTVILAVAAGFSKDDKGKRVASAGSTFVGSIGAIANDHLLLWSITANDRTLFNKLMSLSVCFDSPGCKTGYDRLVPFELGSGKATDAVPR